MKHLFLLFIGLSSVFGNLWSQKPPRLVVGIVVDQLTYDYLYRFQHHFSKTGFKTFLQKGAVVHDMRYNYVPTYTGPGHASIYTGTTPSEHGIVANEWYDYSRQELVNCVTDTLHHTVGGTESEEGQRSPKTLQCNTLSDVLRTAQPKSKVLAVSMKDRGAILPGGHMADQVYWYDKTNGHFITSTFYQPILPEWVKAFNLNHRPETMMKQTWELSKPIQQYVNQKDSSVYEVLLPGKSVPAFPYNFSRLSGDNRLFEIFLYTPWSNTHLTDFAIEGIQQNGLGKDDVTDFVSISYSTPDYVGHAFGPQSTEIEDLYIKLDLEISRVLEACRKQAGTDFVVFITADHAAVPVPQFLVDHQQPGGYLFLKQNLLELEREMQNRFGQNFLLAEENQNIYLDIEAIANNGLELNRVLEEVKSVVQTWEGVSTVYTKDELMSNTLTDFRATMVKKGFDVGRSGQVIYQLQSGYLPKSADTEKARRGTSHGSGYTYDTHVPLLVAGKNVRKGNIYRSCEITDIAPTVALMMQLSFPYCTTGKPIVELFEK